jgi:hypothetical protein
MLIISLLILLGKYNSQGTEASGSKEDQHVKKRYS